MDRISEIRDHLAVAEKNEQIASDHYWEASRLIWEEVTAGSSRRGLARLIGKSHTHVRYMYNCWDLVGRQLAESTLPSFNQVYNSPEVRGELDDSGDEHGGNGRGRGRGGGHDHEPSDRSSHGIIMGMAELVGNPAYAETISDDDWVILRELPQQIRRFLRDYGG